MYTGASTVSEPGVSMVIVCQPGSRETSTETSTTPPRSALTVRTMPSTSMVTSTSPTGTLVKLRQPRTRSSRFSMVRAPRDPGFGCLVRSTRPSTLIRAVDP